MKTFLMLFVTMMFSAVAFAGDVETLINPWVALGFSVLSAVLEIFTPVLVVLASYAAWKLAGKLGIEKEEATDHMIRTYVKQGINWADAWAAKQASKPSAEDRKAEIAKKVLELINDSGLPNIAADKLLVMIEAQLAYDNKTKLIEGKENVINE